MHKHTVYTVPARTKRNNIYCTKYDRDCICKLYSFTCVLLPAFTSVAQPATA